MNPSCCLYMKIQFLDIIRQSIFINSLLAGIMVDHYHLHFDSLKFIPSEFCLHFGPELL